jgi:hypothetical protein
MLAISQAGNRSNYIARSLAALGGAAADLGRWDEAATHFAGAVRLSRSGETRGDRAHIAWGLAGLARVALAAGRLGQAARLLGATEAWWTGSIIPWWLRERDRAVDAVRAQMDPAEFESAWTEGLALPLDQAIALALQEVSAG